MTAGLADRRTGKRVAAAAGLSAALVLGSTAILKDSVVTQYHVFRLGREPGYLLRLAGSELGPPAREAVRRFYSRPEKKGELCEAYLKSVERACPWTGRLLTDLSQDPEQVWVALAVQGAAVHWCVSTKNGVSDGGTLAIARHPELPIARNLQSLLVDVRYNLDPLRGLAVSVLSGADRAAWPPDLASFNAVCLFEKKKSEQER